MIRVGVIVANDSLPELLPIKDKLKNKCDIHFLTYDNVAQVEQLYIMNVPLYDAFAMNWFPYNALKKIGTSFVKPIYCYILNDRDMYKKMFAISLKYKGLDLNRVLTDVQLLNHELVEMDVEEIFGIYKKYIAEYLQSQTVDEHFYERLIQNHIKLHESGVVDLSITVFSKVYKELQRFGYAVEFITASHQTVQELIEKIAHEIGYEQFLANHIAIGRLTGALDQQVLLTALADFNKKERAYFSIQEHESFVELYSLKKDLLRLTNDFTRDELANYLRKHLSCELFIGWGVGKDAEEAKKRAIVAYHEAVVQKEPSIIMTSTDDLIIPTQRGTSMKAQTEELGKLQELSEQLNISVLILKKIRMVIEKMRSNFVTSEDIAFHLGITVRSANRMLKELENKQLAQQMYTKHEKQRGRPKKVYKINLMK